MIIVEGPDGAGKTQLIQRLSTHLGYEIIPKAVSPDMTAMVDLVQWSVESLQRGFGPYLYDRHTLISEGIYGPITRGSIRSPFQDRFQLLRLMERLRQLHPVVVFCLPGLETVRTNVTRPDTDNSEVVPHIGPIYWQYHWLYCSGMFPNRYLWDYTQKDQAPVFDELVWSITSQVTWREKYK